MRICLLLKYQYSILGVEVLSNFTFITLFDVFLVVEEKNENYATKSEKKKKNAWFDAN